MFSRTVNTVLQRGYERTGHNINDYEVSKLVTKIDIRREASAK